MLLLYKTLLRKKSSCNRPEAYITKVWCKTMVVFECEHQQTFEKLMLPCPVRAPCGSWVSMWREWIRRYAHCSGCDVSFWAAPWVNTSVFEWVRASECECGWGWASAPAGLTLSCMTVCAEMLCPAAWSPCAHSSTYARQRPPSMCRLRTAVNFSPKKSPTVTASIW